jgi:hypothetical protein
MFKRARSALGRFLSENPEDQFANAHYGVQTPLPPAEQNPFCGSEFLSIDICEDTEDDRACRTAHLRGQFLARQDLWEDLADEIEAADRDRVKTPAGMPVSELLAYGARADILNAAEAAIARPTRDESALFDCIMALENLLREHPRDPIIATLVAMTHVDIGWMCRGSRWESMISKEQRQRFVSHFERAAEILEPHDAMSRHSPLVASVQCSLQVGRTEPHAQLANRYESLIDLDPMNHRPMRALGNHMLPRWFGSYRELELEARRTAARTQDSWGAAGYTWVYFDAVANDEGASALVDVDFFIDGLRDIARLRKDQETINLLTAYCAVVMRNRLGLEQAADMPRLQIADCAGWLIRDHLTELHPMIWAHASEGFDNNTQVTSPTRFAARGRADGLRAIAEQFSDDINNGLRVTFTANGPKLDRI